jgi:hypothetical protein
VGDVQIESTNEEIEANGKEISENLLSIALTILAAVKGIFAGENHWSKITLEGRFHIWDTRGGEAEERIQINYRHMNSRNGKEK